MATIDGHLSSYVRSIEGANLIDAKVNTAGNLILTRKDGTTIDAGLVKHEDPASPDLWVVRDSLVQLSLGGDWGRYAFWDNEITPTRFEYELAGAYKEYLCIYTPGTYFLSASMSLKGGPAGRRIVRLMEANDTELRRVESTSAGGSPWVANITANIKVTDTLFSFYCLEHYVTGGEVETNAAGTTMRFAVLKLS